MRKRSGNRNKINKLIRKRTKELLRNGRVAISLLVSVAIIIIFIIISISIKSQAINEETMEPISDNVTMVKSSDGKWVPVPKGYSASKIPGEDSVDGGFVIYEGEDIDWTYWENLSSEASAANIADEAESDINTTTKIEKEEQLDTTSKNEQESNDNIDETNKSNSEDNIADENIDSNIENKNYDVKDEVIAVSAIKNTYVTSSIENGSDIERKEEVQDTLKNKDEVLDKSNTNTEDSANIDNSNIDDTNEEVETKEPDNKIDDINKEQEEKNLDVVDINPNITQNEEMQDELLAQDGVSPLADGDTTDNSWMLEHDVNTFNLQCSRNQFVWVPIEDPSEIYGVDANGKLWGKSYNFNDSGKYANGWKEVDGVISRGNYWEPDILNEYDSNVFRGITRYEFLQKEFEQNFAEMVESIQRYGGFYIGRYETGYENGASVKKMDGRVNGEVYDSMYKKCETLGKGKNAVTTSMIWGCLWDATLDWFVQSGATLLNTTDPLTYATVRSNMRGNFTNATFIYYENKTQILNGEYSTNTPRKAIPAGSTEYTKINNIYDMAGNMYDRTLERNGAYRIVRGGGLYQSSGVLVSRAGAASR